MRRDRPVTVATASAMRRSCCRACSRGSGGRWRCVLVADGVFVAVRRIAFVSVASAARIAGIVVAVSSIVVVVVVIVSIDLFESAA